MPSRLAPSLPAAKMKSVSLAAAMASLWAGISPPRPPKEPLTRRTPLALTAWKPRTWLAVGTMVSTLMRTGMILVFHVMPAVPTPLLPAAPVMPPTWEPWPFRSRGSESSAGPVTSTPGTTLGAKSAWSVWMPESMIAAVKAGLPVVWFQARSASMSAPGVPARPSMSWPPFSAPHCMGNSGSFGATYISCT